MEVVRCHLRELLQYRLYDSAELLGQFLLSSGAFPSHTVSTMARIENTILFADALVGKKEYRRAVHYYRQAIQLLRLAGGSMNNPQEQEARAELETEVHMKIGNCLMDVCEYKEAISELETIPSSRRKVTVMGWLGKLYRITGYKGAAQTTYKECLRQCPFAVEAVIGLAELSMKPKDLEKYIKSEVPIPSDDPTPSTSNPSSPLAMIKSPSGLVYSPHHPIPLSPSNTMDTNFPNGTHPSKGSGLQFSVAVKAPAVAGVAKPSRSHASHGAKAHAEDGIGARGGVAGPRPASQLLAEGKLTHEELSYLLPLVKGYAELVVQNFAVAASQFQHLCERFPDILHLHLVAARAIYGKGDAQGSITLLHKTRLLDPANIAGMDLYALVLKDRGQKADLAKLVGEIVATDAYRAEVWLAASALCQLKGEHGAALDYLDQGLKLDGSNHFLHLEKGRVLLLQHQSEAALSAFRAAEQLSPTIDVFKGIVASAQQALKHKEAFAAARTALKLLPYGGAALALMGDVYRRIAQQDDKARQSYEGAIAKDPSCVDAVLALTDLHVCAGRLAEAIAILQHQISLAGSDVLHAKLANMYACMCNPEEALTHYQAALGFNPACKDAILGMEELEKQLRGGDVDFEEDASSCVTPTPDEDADMVPQEEEEEEEQGSGSEAWD